MSALSNDSTEIATKQEQRYISAQSFANTDAVTPVKPSTSDISLKRDTQFSKATKPADDLAVAAFFLAAGLYLSYFPIDAHTPSVQGLFQTLAYCCYGIGFLGGSFGLSKLSKNQFFETFGLGIILLLVTYGLHTVADLLHNIPTIAIPLRLLLVIPIGFSAYGIIRGILYLLITDEGALPATQQQRNSEFADNSPKEKMKRKQIAGIIIATLSVLTALLQALPAIFPIFKQLFHIP